MFYRPDENNNTLRAPFDLEMDLCTLVEVLQQRRTELTSFLGPACTATGSLYISSHLRCYSSSTRVLHLGSKKSVTVNPSHVAAGL